MTPSKSSRGHLAGIAMATFASFGGILLGYDTGTINGILQMPDWLKTFGDPIPSIGTGAAVHFSIATSTESLVVSILSAGTFLGQYAVLSPILSLCTQALIHRSSGRRTRCRYHWTSNWHVDLMRRLFPRRRPPNRRVNVAHLHRRPLLCRLRRRSHIHPCAHVPIRVLAEMDQGRCCLLLVVDNHGRSSARFSHQQRYEGSPGSWRVAYPHRYSIYMDCYTLRRNAMASRGSVDYRLRERHLTILSLSQTPRWLMMVKRETAASRSLSRLTGVSPDDLTVQAELKAIREALQKEEEAGEKTYRDCFRLAPNRIALRTLTSIVIHALQQLSGITFIFYCKHSSIPSRHWTQILILSRTKTGLPFSPTRASKIPS